MTGPKDAQGHGGASGPVLALRAAYGVVTARLIAVAAELGIADLLNEGPRPVADLAARTGSDCDALYRVLRTLASVGVFTEPQAGVFALTPAACALRTGSADSVRNVVLELGSSETFRALAELGHSVATGEPAFDQAYQTDWWSYLAARPRRWQIFNNAQTVTARQVHAVALKSFDFSRARRLVDIGGGHGTLVADVLGRHPHLTGAVFDQPDVVAGAVSTFEKAGVTSRAAAIGGSFFESVPAGDTYILSMILHDWSDADSRRILANIRAVIPADGTLLVIDPILPPGDTPHMGKFVDILMLTHFAGRERTEREFTDLLRSAGFRHVQTHCADRPTGLLVAVPA